MKLLNLIAKWFKNTGFLSILIFVFLTVFLIHLFAQGGLGPNIEFDGDPWITGPSGTYTTATLPTHLYISIQVEATGFGDVTLSLTNINVTDQPLKSISSSGTEIGRMRAVFGVPFSAAATYSYSSHGYAIPTSTIAKTYNWSASGSVKLIPYAWEWSLLGSRNITGSWVAKTSLAKTESAGAQSGSWVVTSSTGSGSGNGSGPGCSNNPSYNWCTDTGACTTRSPSGVPGECGHNYCCCAPYGSPMYNNNSNNGDSGTSDSSSGSSSDSSSGSGNTNSGSDDSTPSPPTPSPPTPSPPTPSPPTPSPPTMHPCGVHSSDTPGDHSVVSFSCGLHTYNACSPPSRYVMNRHVYYGSCTHRNSEGQRCTVFGYYGCQSHTHTYD